MQIIELKVYFGFDALNYIKMCIRIEFGSWVIYLCFQL